jgi:hypothetical protein
MLSDHLEHRVAGKHLLSGEQVVRHTSERVEIARAIDVIAQRHLRRHVGRRTHDHAFDRAQRLRGVNACGFHETEIEHLDEILLDTRPGRGECWQA